MIESLPLNAGAGTIPDQELLNFMSQFISENKLKRFEEVLAYRTNYITVVLEDIYQPQNASAVLRTAENLGIHQIHVIEQANKYHLNKHVLVGSSKWINLKRHHGSENNVENCFNELRSQGYQIVATSPHQNNFEPENLDLSKPIALVFGNEKEGISDYTKKNADAFVRIPMFGFTESYNISVSAAICLYVLTNRIHQEIPNWNLSEDEKKEIQYRWIKKVIKRFDLLETEFYTSHSGKKQDNK